MRTIASFGPEQVAIAQQCSERIARTFGRLQSADVDDLVQIGLETALRMWPRYRDHICPDFEQYIGRAVAKRMTFRVRQLPYAVEIPSHIFTELKHAKKHAPEKAQAIGDTLARFRPVPCDEIESIAAVDRADEEPASRADVVRELGAEHVGVAMAARVAAGEKCRAVAAEYGLRQGEAKRLRDEGTDLVRRHFTFRRLEIEPWSGRFVVLIGGTKIPATAAAAPPLLALVGSVAVAARPLARRRETGVTLRSPRGGDARHPAQAGHSYAGRRCVDPVSRRFIFGSSSSRANRLAPISVAHGQSVRLLESWKMSVRNRLRPQSRSSPARAAPRLRAGPMPLAA